MSETRNVRRQDARGRRVRECVCGWGGGGMRE